MPDILHPGDGLSQLIQGAVGGEAVVKQHHVSPGSVVGQRPRAAFRQGGIAGVQLLGRVEHLLVGAEVLYRHRQGQLGEKALGGGAVIEFVYNLHIPAGDGNLTGFHVGFLHFN